MFFLANLWRALIVWLQSKDRIASPYENIMGKLGPGFGEKNKYAWSMAELGDYLYVGTYNADLRYRDSVKCLSELRGISLKDLDIHSLTPPPEVTDFFACLIDEDGSQIWRYGYSTETWEKVVGGRIALGGDRDGQIYTGFRSMQIYQGHIYAITASSPDITAAGFGLGPGIFGVSSDSFLIRSADGVAWEEVPCGRACPFKSDAAINSFLGRRALEAHDGKLFMGTVTGTEEGVISLWSLDATDNWLLEYDFSDRTADGLNFDAITALTVFQDKLWIGLSGSAGFGLFTYESRSRVLSNDLGPVGPMTTLNGDVYDLSFGTRERKQQFSAFTFHVHDNALYVGTANLNEGFALLKYTNETSFELLSADGFGEALNSYAWSMQTLNGQLVLGTFNRLSEGLITPGVLALEIFVRNPLKLLADALDPRGPGQLWLFDETGTKDRFLKLPMPLDWGKKDYGVRTMVTSKRNDEEMLYIGSATSLFWPGPNVGMGVWKVDEFSDKFLDKVRVRYP